MCLKNYIFLPPNGLVFLEGRVMEIEVGERTSISSDRRFKTSSIRKRHTNASVTTAWTSARERWPPQLSDVWFICLLKLKISRITSLVNALELIAFSPAMYWTERRFSVRNISFPDLDAPFVSGGPSCIARQNLKLTDYLPILLHV